MKLQFISLILALIVLAYPTYASAHVLKTDGSIGAVMHVNPNDDPVAGQQSSFFFEFKDKKNTFDPQKCTCSLTILKDGTALFTQPLFHAGTKSNLTSTSVYYTFPDRGAYTIRVTGQPQSGAAFNQFLLDYDIRVNRISDGQGQSSESNWFTEHLPVLIGGVLGVSALLFFMLQSTRHEKRKKES